MAVTQYSKQTKCSGDQVSGQEYADATCQTAATGKTEKTEPCQNHTTSTSDSSCKTFKNGVLPTGSTLKTFRGVGGQITFSDGDRYACCVAAGVASKASRGGCAAGFLLAFAALAGVA